MNLKEQQNRVNKSTIQIEQLNVINFSSRILRRAACFSVLSEIGRLGVESVAQPEAHLHSGGNRFRPQCIR